MKRFYLGLKIILIVACLTEAVVLLVALVAYRSVDSLIHPQGRISGFSVSNAEAGHAAPKQ